MANKVPVIIRGVQYESLAAAGRALGVSLSCVWHHLENGTLDHTGLGLRSTQAKPVTIDGVSYPSILAAARTLKKGRDTIKKMVKDR